MDIFADLWILAQKGGPFANAMLLLILYFVNQERKEVIKENRVLRDQNEVKNEAINEKLLNGFNNVSSAIKDLHETLAGVGTTRKR